ncbi:MAG: oligosaccharide flippase family protein [Deltaproteobacteria bacterium]|nr:oligosaccharide flippase family protein [Deltaproteobacteria bacterium]MBN2672599.1 oligosaccharide flippase family protein [Deltaproteobacteria bacterium]
MSGFKKWLIRRVGKENLEFLTHTRNYLSATVIQSILMALAIPVITQLLLPEEYGVLSVFVSLYTLLSIAFSLNLRAGIVRYYLDFSDDFDKALGANLLFAGLSTLLIGGVAFIFAAPLAKWIGISIHVYQYAIVTAAFSGILEIYLSYLRGSKQSKHFSLISVLRTALILGGAVILIFQMEDHKYLGKVYAEAIVVGAFSVYALFSMARLSRFSTETKYIRYTCRFSLPLIPHAISRYILGYFDRIIILQLTTKAATGLYSLVYDIAMAMDVIVMATIKAWQPIFFEEYGKGNIKKIERMAVVYSGYMYFAAAAIICFGADLARLFVPSSYFPGLTLLPTLVIGYVFVFLYTLFFQYASYNKKTELISISTLLAGAANIGLNYWFIPIYGYQAAAYTTTASFGLLFIFHYVNTRFVLKAKVIRLVALLPNFLLVFVVGAFVLLGESFELDKWIWRAIKLIVVALNFYYFVIIVAQGKKTDE